MRASILVLALLAPVFTGLGGCFAAGVAAGAYGVVKYDRNKLYRDYEADMDDLWVAMRDVAKDMGYAEPGILSHTDTEGIIETGDLWARVEAYPEGYCGIWVRIGTFESEDNTFRANRFLSEVARLVDDETAM